MGAKLGEQLEKKGVRPLIWADYGFVQFANNKKAIKSPEDFAGLKIRGYSKYSAETIKALGASSVTMGSGKWSWAWVYYVVCMCLVGHYVLSCRYDFLLYGIVTTLIFKDQFP